MLVACWRIFLSNYLTPSFPSVSQTSISLFFLIISTSLFLYLCLCIFLLLFLLQVNPWYQTPNKTSLHIYNKKFFFYFISFYIYLKINLLFAIFFLMWDWIVLFNTTTYQCLGATYIYIYIYSPIFDLFWLIYSFLAPCHSSFHRQIQGLRRLN